MNFLCLLSPTDIFFNNLGSKVYLEQDGAWLVQKQYMLGIGVSGGGCVGHAGAV